MGTDAGSDERLSPAAFALVLINVIVFFVSLKLGDGFVSKGMMTYDSFAGGEKYRLVTAMFLHADINHILSNMMILYFAGELVESRVGPALFLCIYMISGILGNVTSYYYEMISGARYSSLGASGAVYGILGALFLLAVVKTKGLSINPKRILAVTVFLIYGSFSVPNIDFMAHIGGLISGFILMIPVNAFMRLGSSRTGITSRRPTGKNEPRITDGQPQLIGDDRPAETPDDD